jgi:ferrous iron transport protein B
VNEKPIEVLASRVSPRFSLRPEHTTLSIAEEASLRYGWAQNVVDQVERREETGPSLTDRLDGFLIHRFFGLIIFAGIMFLVFQSIYTWAVPFMDLIDFLFVSLSAGVGSLFEDMPVLQSLIADGVIAGVGSVVIFLPQIIILFLFVAVLEDSGYLARTAFLMDKLVSWTGLNGRAFIPMLSGFACAIPAIMATRVMPDPKARMATILVTPLTSCSARLPVYLLLISTFIEPRFGAGWAAFCLFAMHALGLVLALPIAWLLNRKVLKSRPLPFVLEMPSYKMPKAGNVLYRAGQAGGSFLRQAGTIIFACSILIWALSYFPRSPSIEEPIEAEYAVKIAALGQEDLSPEELAERMERLDEEKSSAIAGAYLEHSYLGRAGKAVQPVFAPLGFDWKISVGVLGAFPAREVIISTLGIVYSLGEVDETSTGLKDRLKTETNEKGEPVFTPLVAVTLMVFFALCSQCMSTLATVRRELNSWKWTAFLFFYMTLLAYLGGLIIYQGGRLLGWV